ncbi:MAG TPA: hypothetical protein VJY39_22175, partial [Acidisphaera sp.]|nr:hypothetical protein [Acidisphaera sp.]
GRVEVDADPQSWLQRDVMSFPPEKIARVAVAAAAPSGGEAPPNLVFTGKDGTLTLNEPAEHPPLDDGKVAEVAAALQNVTFEDVRRAGSAPSGQAQGVGTFAIADGPEVAATVTKDGDAYWVSFDVTGKDADALQRRVQGWDYKLESFKAQDLVPTLDALKAAAPPAQAQPAPQSAPAQSAPAEPAPASVPQPAPTQAAPAEPAPAPAPAEPPK